MTFQLFEAEEFCCETSSDLVFSQLLQYLKHGFPSSLPMELKQFAKLVPDLYELDGILFLMVRLLFQKNFVLLCCI